MVCGGEMSTETSRDPESVTWLENLISGLNMILKGEDDDTDLELYAISAEELLDRTGEHPVETPPDDDDRIHKKIRHITTGLNEVLDNTDGWDELALYVSQLKKLADDVKTLEDDDDKTDQRRVDILMIRFIKQVYTMAKPTLASVDLQFTAQTFQKEHDFIYAVSDFDNDTYSAFIMDKVLKMYGENDIIKEIFRGLLQIWHSHFAEWDDYEQDQPDDNDWGQAQSRGHYDDEYSD
jgi:hypothetical protein